MYVTLRGLISTMASFSNSYLTSRQRLIRSDFRNKALAITLWGKNHPCLSENKETRLLILAFARHDSNATGTVRLPPRAASCRARSMFCRSPVRGGNHFRPPSILDGPLAVALSENMDRPWQYCRRNHPASPPAWYTRPHFIYSIVSKFSDPFVRLNL